MVYDLQKASLTKRLSAFLFDFMIMAVLAVGFACVFSALVGYDHHSGQLTEKISSIQDDNHISSLEEEHGVYYADYPYLTEEEKLELPEEVRLSFEKCQKEISENDEVQWLKALVFNLILTNVSLSLLFAFIVGEFAVPLWLKNGQTLGKKIFSVAVMRNDGIKISPFVLFTRTILGKYTIGTMVPLFALLMLFSGSMPLIPLSILLLVFLLQIVLCVTSRTNSFIHDYLAATVAVDFQSQMIFDSVEAKNAYVLRIHSDERNEKNKAD